MSDYPTCSPIGYSPRIVRAQWGGAGWVGVPNNSDNTDDPNVLRVSSAASVSIQSIIDPVIPYAAPPLRPYEINVQLHDWRAPGNMVLTPGPIYRYGSPDGQILAYAVWNEKLIAAPGPVRGGWVNSGYLCVVVLDGGDLVLYAADGVIAATSGEWVELDRIADQPHLGHLFWASENGRVARSCRTETYYIGTSSNGELNATTTDIGFIVSVADGVISAEHTVEISQRTIYTVSTTASGSYAFEVVMGTALPPSIYWVNQCKDECGEPYPNIDVDDLVAYGTYRYITDRTGRRMAIPDAVSWEYPPCSILPDGDAPNPADYTGYIDHAEIPGRTAYWSADGYTYESTITYHGTTPTLWRVRYDDGPEDGVPGIEFAYVLEYSAFSSDQRPILIEENCVHNRTTVVAYTGAGIPAACDYDGNVLVEMYTSTSGGYSSSRSISLTGSSDPIDWYPLSDPAATLNGTDETISSGGYETILYSSDGRISERIKSVDSGTGASSVEAALLAADMRYGVSIVDTYVPPHTIIVSTPSVAYELAAPSLDTELPVNYAYCHAATDKRGALIATIVDWLEYGSPEGDKKTAAVAITQDGKIVENANLYAKFDLSSESFAFAPYRPRS